MLPGASRGAVPTSATNSSCTTLAWSVIRSAERSRVERLGGGLYGRRRASVRLCLSSLSDVSVELRRLAIRQLADSVHGLFRACTRGVEGARPEAADEVVQERLERPDFVTHGRCESLRAGASL